MSDAASSAIGSAPPAGAAETPWVVVLGPAETSAAERASARAALDGFDALDGALMLATCRRLELFGIGEPPSVDVLPRATGAAAFAKARLVVGRAATERVLRLAAGLESSVVGEDQVLQQVRGLLDPAQTGAPPDPRLRRLVELAIGVGRRARAGRPPRIERSLADRGLAWLVARTGSLAGRTVVVAGAGPIGAAAARRVRQLGATVVVASRDYRRARDLAIEVGGRAHALADVLPELAGADAIVVALIERLSQQLVAAVLHEPSRQLRDDRDGSGLAAARALLELDTQR